MKFMFRALDKWLCDYAIGRRWGLRVAKMPASYNAAQALTVILRGRL